MLHESLFFYGEDSFQSLERKDNISVKENSLFLLTLHILFLEGRLIVGIKTFV